MILILNETRLWTPVVNFLYATTIFCPRTKTLCITFKFRHITSPCNCQMSEDQNGYLKHRIEDNHKGFARPPATSLSGPQLCCSPYLSCPSTYSPFWRFYGWTTIYPVQSFAPLTTGNDWSYWLIQSWLSLLSCMIMVSSALVHAIRLKLKWESYQLAVSPHVFKRGVLLTHFYPYIP